MNNFVLRAHALEKELELFWPQQATFSRVGGALTRSGADSFLTIQVRESFGK
jgi:hypothetical protein